MTNSTPGACAEPCALCDDTGWEPVYDEAGTQRKVQRCQCRVRLLRPYPESIPREFVDANVTNYRARPCNKIALAIAITFLDTARDLFLSGPVGSGKTRLACSVLNGYWQQCRRGAFLRVPQMLYELQPGRSDEADRLALERQLFTEPLLVLDDVGAERDQATDFTRRTLLMMYDARGDRGLRTIWTSNKDLGELAAMQDDDRLASRIAGRADVVAITCGDFRVVGREIAP